MQNAIHNAAPLTRVPTSSFSRKTTSSPRARGMQNTCAKPCRHRRASCPEETPLREVDGARVLPSLSRHAPPRQTPRPCRLGISRAIRALRLFVRNAAFVLFVFAYIVHQCGGVDHFFAKTQVVFKLKIQAMRAPCQAGGLCHAGKTPCPAQARPDEQDVLDREDGANRLNCLHSRIHRKSAARALHRCTRSLVRYVAAIQMPHRQRVRALIRRGHPRTSSPHSSRYLRTMRKKSSTS